MAGVTWGGCLLLGCTNRGHISFASFAGFLDSGVRYYTVSQMPAQGECCTYRVDTRGSVDVPIRTASTCTRACKNEKLTSMCLLDAL